MQKFKVGTRYGFVIVRIISEHPDCLVAVIKVVDTRVSPPQCRYARIYVTLQNIRREVVKSFMAEGLTDPVSGLDWKELRQHTRSLAKRVGVERLMNVVRKVSNEADKYGSAIYPPLGVTFNAIKRANRLLKRAAAGSTAAENVLKAIRAGAERGSPAHQKAARVVLTLFEASKSMDIDDWLSNRVCGWSVNNLAPNRRFVAPSSSMSLYRSGLR